VIGIAMYTTIITLWKQQKSKSEISRITGHDRKTIRNIINNYMITDQQLPHKKMAISKLIDFKEDILKLLEKDLSVVRIYEELKKLGVSTSYSTLVRYTRDLRNKTDICIRFKTEAGEEAQVDFGYASLQPTPAGAIKKSWFFNMRLSYSRLDYYEVVFDQKVETFIKCHINAFKYFGGVPKIIKIDNLKAAILDANFYEPVHQKHYKEFADYYGFLASPCRPRRPQEKGKTESAVKYCKGNFFAGRSFYSYDQLLLELSNWLEYKCNARVHGTTKKIPRTLFEQEEKECLIKLPIDDFEISNVGVRKLQRDCHIIVDNNYYSAPYKYVGDTLEIKLDSKLLRIYHSNVLIATHIRPIGKGQFITDRSHFPEYKLCTPSSLEYQKTYRQKMRFIGFAAEDFFGKLLINRPNDWHRIAKGIISLEKIYSKNTINLACARALEFEVFTFSKIKTICSSGAYNLPNSMWGDQDDTVKIYA
jgi:transposase